MAGKANILDEGNTQVCLRIIKQTAHELSRTLQEQEVIEVLLAQVVPALAAGGGLVRLLSPDGDELLPAGALGLSKAYLQKGAVDVARSQVDRRVLAGEVVVIPDVTHEPGFQYPMEAAREGLRGMVAVPLTTRERVIGVLRVYLVDTEALQSHDLLLLEAMADLGALALEKVRLHQSLYRTAEALNSSLELEPMLEQVLQATVREMGLKAASVRLLDPERQVLRLVAAYGLSEAYLTKGDIHVARSRVDQRALQGEVVLLYDVKHESGYEYPEEAAREGIRSVLVVPLILKEHTLGAMRAYSVQSRHFGPIAESFLTSVASLIALGIENARLYAALQDRYDDLKLDVAEWHRFLALG